MSLIDTSASPKTSRSPSDRATLGCIAGIIVLPILYLCIRHAWIYPIAGELDPWFYAGYHLHIGELLRDHPSVYYGTRVPWTVFGWIVHHFFAVQPAEYILALALYYTSTFALFYTIRLVFKSALAAFIAACILGTQYWFISAVGGNYIDGPTIACMFLSIAGLSACACGRRWQAGAVLCGAASASFIVLTITYVVFLPLLVGLFLALNYVGLKRPIGRVVLLATAGALGSIVTMGLANWILGGAFIFFTPLVSAAAGIVPQLDRYYSPWDEWFWIAPWVLLPGMTFFASIITIATRTIPLSLILRSGVRSEDVTGDAALLALAAVDITATMVFLLLQLAHVSMLMYSYRANALLPFALPVLGGYFAFGVRGLPRNLALLVAFGAPFLCLSPWVLHVLGTVSAVAFSLGWLHIPLSPHVSAGIYTMLTAPSTVFGGKPWELFWMVGAASLLVALTMLRRGGSLRPALALFSVFFMAFVGVFSDGVQPDSVTLTESLLPFDIAGVIDRYSGDQPVAFLWAKSDPQELMFESAGAMYLSGVDDPQRIKPGQIIVCLSSEGPVAATEAMLHRNATVDINPIAEEHVQRGNVDVDIALVRAASRR